LNGQVGDPGYGPFRLPHGLLHGWKGAEEEDVVEGALVHQVEAGFVAMKKGQLG